MDQDMVNDDIVGNVAIDLDEVFQRGKILNRSYELTYKQKRAGDIILDMEFYSTSS